MLQPTTLVGVMLKHVHARMCTHAHAKFYAHSDWKGLACLHTHTGCRENPKCDGPREAEERTQPHIVTGQHIYMY